MKSFFPSVVFVLIIGSSTDARPGETGMRLIKTSETGPAVWLNPEEVFSLIAERVNFMDVTNRRHPTINPSLDSAKGKCTR
jgi:hypothetical protein